MVGGIKSVVLCAFATITISCTLEVHYPRGTHLRQLWGIIRADLAPGCITAVVQQYCGVDAPTRLTLVVFEHHVGPKSVHIDKGYAPGFSGQARKPPALGHMDGGLDEPSPHNLDLLGPRQKDGVGSAVEGVMMEGLRREQHL